MKIALSPPIYQYKNVLSKNNISEKNNDVKDYNLPHSYYTPINFQGISRVAKNTSRHTLDHYEGCLLGGAIGDAFGAKLESLSLDGIRHKFHGKLKYLLKDSEGVANITDDTQMTLFTIDGLLKSFSFLKNELIEDFYKQIYKAYQDWYITQSNNRPVKSRGLLADINLYKQCAPGKTCLSSLQKGIMGTVKEPINDSEGNGGVMRIAPVGLLFYKNPEKAFEIGLNIAAMTHGNPNAYLPAGFLSALIAELIQNKTLYEALIEVKKILEKYPNHESLMHKINQIQNYTKINISDESIIEKFNGGWTGNDALSIALYFVHKYKDSYKQLMIATANHSGDSDTCASIAGYIYGALKGVNNLPKSYVKCVEFNSLIKQYSKLLYNVSTFD